MPAPEDVEITLRHGSQRAVVSPYGAALRRYFLDDGGSETAVVWGYSGGANKKGGQGDVLIPFPSRIKDGRYTFQGNTFQMERNDKEGPNAIHGFLRGITWEHEQSSESEVRFRTQIRAEAYADKGYPFSLGVEMAYRLEGDGLACEFRIRNAGDRNAPVGAGFHPYFTVGTDTVEDAEALIPANQYLEFEPTLVPTGNLIPVEGTEMDFREFRRVGETRFNHCYTGLQRDGDGLARARMRDPDTGRSVTVWMDDSFRYIVVYTGDAIPEPHARRALAIEPMTCATDAFNHPEWGLEVLSPGEAFEGRFGIVPE
ncbi:MAG: aldose epimerase [Armatimonadetes bacterium]|nr:aldose epimerase [Armatimonadota bacterium]